MASTPHPGRPRHRRTLGMSLLAASLAASLVGIGCGKKGAASRSAASPDRGTVVPVGPDLSTPEATLAATTRAIHRGDFQALAACCTDEGIERVRRDLLAWNAILSDASTGPRALARIPSPRDDAEKALYRAGFGGDPDGLLRMLSRTLVSDLSPAADSVPRTSIAGVERIETDRPGPGGARRRVVLVLKVREWRVDRLAL